MPRGSVRPYAPMGSRKATHPSDHDVYPIKGMAELEDVWVVPDWAGTTIDAHNHVLVTRTHYYMLQKISQWHFGRCSHT